MACKLSLLEQRYGFKAISNGRCRLVYNNPGHFSYTSSAVPHILVHVLEQTRQGQSSMCESVFKVLLIGDHSVGKTTFVASYVLNKWIANLKTTIGADYAVKSIKWSDTETVRLHLWDIAGQDRFHAMARTYFRGASGCVVMFDVTNYKTLESAQEWKSELDAKVELPNGEPIPCVLLGNKIDLIEDQEVTQAQMNQCAKDSGFFYCAFCSVKKTQNIHEPMSVLVRRMLEQEHTSGEVLQAFDRLSTTVTSNSNESTRCCATT